MAENGSLRDVAIRILTESLTPLRPERIAARAISTGALPPGAAFLEIVMEDILDTDVGRNGYRSAFVRASPGHYGLNLRCPSGPEEANLDLQMPTTRNLKDAAAAVLRGSLGPLSLSMLVRRIMSEFKIRPNLRTLSAVLEESMKAEMMASGSRSRLARLPTGHYALRSHPAYALDPGMLVEPNTPIPRLADYPYPRTSYRPGASNIFITHDFESDLTHMGVTANPPAQITAKPPKAKPAKKHKDGSRSYSEYVGKGSEYLVASKLLFLRHNVSVPIVDTGADLIITADDLTHNHIQVKSALINNNAYRFGLKSAIFTKDAKKNMFYVFVLRQDTDALTPPDFLIFPHTTLAEYLRQEHIQQRTKTLSIKSFQDGESILLGSKNLDVSSFRNNWKPLSTARARRE